MLPAMRRLLLLVALASCKPTESEAPKPSAPVTSVAVTPVKSSEPARPLEVPNGKPIPTPSAAVRETKKVKVDGVDETWTLRWKSPPVEHCMDTTWYTAPCQGVEYGEKGHLELVREREGAPADILSLDPLFSDNSAELPRYTVEKNDPIESVDVAKIKTRPVVSVMKLGDYDHDGRETELVIATGTVAFGHTTGAVVGISKKEPKLHVFKGTDGEYLLLDHLSSWEKVRAAKTSPVSIVTLKCGDHGSDTEDSVLISFGPNGLASKEGPKKKCP